MTEEEKKAIEKTKRILYLFPESKEIETLLNLIEKQEKEIEELREEIKELKENSINKERIREKMNEVLVLLEE